MRRYVINTEDRGLSCTEDEEEQTFLVVMDVDEFQNQKEKFLHHNEIIHSMGSIRYCKVEAYKDCIWGTIRVPQKSEQRQPQFSFGFYMTRESIYLIEDTGDIKQWIAKQAEKMRDVNTPDEILLQILEQMIENDILYLSHLEKEMEDMEDGLNSGHAKNFFSHLTRYRQKLSELNAYYEQLSSVGDKIQSHEFITSVGNSEQWDRYSRRTERLQNHVHLLRENVIQLRELYQSQQDAQQNKIMCMLTVVTTLFLPLTLLTGWYGMNFAYMPELQWKYGYITVIIAAVVIVVIEIIYFKKRKFF